MKVNQIQVNLVKVYNCISQKSPLPFTTTHTLHRRTFINSWALNQKYIWKRFVNNISKNGFQFVFTVYKKNKSNNNFLKRGLT